MKHIREICEKPGRKCWYEEGIQICEMEAISAHWFSMPNGAKIELKLLENWKVNK